MAKELLNVLTSVREKLKDIHIDDNATIEDVKKKYRKLFDTEEDHYSQNKKQLESDILVESCGRESCGIKNLKQFYDDLGCCWIDFFGSDSFSDSKEKKQVFFATLCKDYESEKRGEHVKAYNDLKEKENAPVDIFIQLFFISEGDMKKIIDDGIEVVVEEERKKREKKLKQLLKKGFYIDYGDASGNASVNTSDNQGYYNDIKNSNCTKQDRLKLLTVIFEILGEKEGLFKLDYAKLCKPNGHEEQFMNFIKGVCDLNKSLHEEVKYVYFLPIPCPDGSNGMVCMGAKRELKADGMDHINAFAFNVLYPFVSSYKTVWQQIRIKREAIKSAKAAIMSRNLSHNLGSHVMSYLKQSLKSVADMEKSGALVEFSPKGKTLLVEKEDKKEDKIKLVPPELPFLVGTGRFISYLQERQDYIATVSTDYIPYPAMVNFKDNIYDELNPDYRFQRHPEWQGHKPANVLLENIARSEGLSRQPEIEQKGNNIVIKYRSFDGLNTDNAKEDYNSLRQWNFSLPGGIMGRQAFFSIVENVIRNAAKHGVRSANDDLIITFDIIDPLIDIDKLKDINDKNARYENSKDIADLYIVTLTTSGKITSASLTIIQKAIRDMSLVDDNWNLDESNKGIKEMLISAAWLRGLKMEELDKNERKALTPLLRANMVDGNLQYVFCVPRVKEVALIVAEKWQKDDRVWNSNGWFVFTVEEYLRERNKDFNFVILDNKLSKKEIEKKIRKCSSNRFYVESDNTNLKKQEILFDIRACKDYKEKKDFDAAELNLYKQLAGPDDDFKIALSDSSNSSITQIKTSYVDDIQSQPSKEDNLYKYKYIYRKHNDTKKEFDEFVDIYSRGNDWNNLEFVEGITGGNSTDRLIRHNEINELWAYKHLHAMKTKVAIFDERLFSYVMGVESCELQSAFTDWDAVLASKTEDDARVFVKNYDDTHDKWIAPNRELRVSFRDYSKKQMVAFLNEHYPVGIDFPIKEVSSLVNHKKKIDLYTMNKTDKGVTIWGVNFYNLPENGVYGNCEVVGKIIFEQEQDKLLPKVLRYSETQYDYISLHQGLLDKVYEAIPKDMDNDDIRKEVTKAIYNKYMTQTSDDKDYLQGMVIHSGRSKPNSKDMPQHQPFLQYSAIEHALFDCKYTLVEVLDFACFDQ